MGDRFVVGFCDTKDTPPVWLYSHWGGSERVETIADAIQKAQPRWTDPSYATRIAISSIIGEDWSRETGFGISAGTQDFFYLGLQPDYDDVHLVTWADKTVTVQSLDGKRKFANFGFEVFCATAGVDVLS